MAAQTYLLTLASDLLMLGGITIDSVDVNGGKLIFSDRSRKKKTTIVARYQRGKLVIRERTVYG